MHSRGVSGVWFPGKDWYNALPFIWENGGEVAVEMDGKWDAQFSSPESQAGIKQVEEIMTKGSTAPKDGDERDAWVPLRTEKAATLSAPSWAYWSIIADEDKKDHRADHHARLLQPPGQGRRRRLRVRRRLEHRDLGQVGQPRARPEGARDHHERGVPDDPGEGGLVPAAPP